MQAKTVTWAAAAAPAAAPSERLLHRSVPVARDDEDLDEERVEAELRRLQSMRAHRDT